MLRTTTVRLLLLLLFLTPFQRSHAQQDSLAQFYEALPDSLIPSGLLLDQSIYNRILLNTKNHPSAHPGTLPLKSITPTGYQWLHALLYSAQRLDSNGLFPGNLPVHVLHPHTFEAQDSVVQRNGQVPLAAAWIESHHMTPHALDSGFLWWDANAERYVLPSDTLWLDSAQTQYQFELNRAAKSHLAFDATTAFVATAQQSTHYIDGNSGTVVFQFPSTHLQHNRPTQPQLHVDFADGNGFVPMALGQLHHVHYNSITGKVEPVQKVIVVRAAEGGDTVFAAVHLKLLFNVPQPDQQWYTEGAQTICGGKVAVGNQSKVSIRLADASKGLHKPLILIEGFDGDTRPFGAITYRGLVTGHMHSSSGTQVYKQLAHMPNLFDSIAHHGHDLIFIDFENARRPIQENAQHVLAVLHWIKSQNPSALSKTRILGASMGGLVAKQALLTAENQGCCLSLALYGSIDSPHRGSFIHPGLQMQCKTLATQFGLVKSVRQSWTHILNSPAAQQLTRNHIGMGAQANFANGVENLVNYMPKTRTIAAVNGAFLALPQPLQDSSGRIVSARIPAEVPIAHHVGTTWPVVKSNASAIRGDMNLFYQASYAKRHSGSYVFEAKPLFQPVGLFIHMWGVHYGRFGQQVAAKILSKLPLVGALFHALIEPIQQSASWLLSRLYKKAEHNAIVLADIHCKEDLSEVPGAYADLPQSFADAAPWLFTVHSPLMTFVPTFSALNAAEEHVHARFANNVHLSPFHSVVGPGLLSDWQTQSEEHLAITPQLGNWLIDQLNFQPNLLHGFTLAKDFNMAVENAGSSPYQYQIPTGVVKPGATLRLAGQGGLKDKKMPLAAKRQHLQFTLSKGCRPSHVTVNGGLELGATDSSTAKLTVPDGATLFLEQGAQVTIYNNSELHIAPGGTLKIAPGAVFNLQGKEAVLSIEGQVILEHQATLSVNGPGAVHLNPLDTTWLQASPHAMISMVDPIGTRLVLQSSVHIPATLDKLVLNHVILEPKLGAQLELHATATMKRVFCEITGAKTWSPIRVWENKGVHISHSVFKSLDTAIVLQGKATNTALFYNTFEDCNVGVLAKAQPSALEHNVFRRCDIGVLGDQLGLTAHANGFFHGETGLVISRPKSGWSKLSGNLFMGMENGVEVISGNLQLECNTFMDNAVGVNAAMAKVKLTANAANTFSNNTVGVFCDEVKSLELINGKNNFTGTVGHAIQGTLSSKSTTGTAVNAQNNYCGNLSVQLLQGGNAVAVTGWSNAPFNALLNCTEEWTDPGKANISAQRTSVFPNPSNGNTIHIQLTERVAKLDVTLLDSRGRKVEQLRLYSGSAFELESLDLPKGYYLLLLSNDAFSEVHPLIIQ